MTDRVFAKFLGSAIRRAREGRGWTRDEMVKALPSGITNRTLLSYEHGIRYVTVVRLVELCRALEVPASEVLRRAEVAAADLPLHTLTVNLRAVTKEPQVGFEAVAEWARHRLSGGGGALVRLEPATVREIAAALGLDHSRLAGYLAEFSVDEQRESM